MACHISSYIADRKQGQADAELRWSELDIDFSKDAYDLSRMIAEW